MRALKTSNTYGGESQPILEARIKRASEPSQPCPTFRNAALITNPEASHASLRLESTRQETGINCYFRATEENIFYNSPKSYIQKDGNRALATPFVSRRATSQRPPKPKRSLDQGRIDGAIETGFAKDHHVADDIPIYRKWEGVISLASPASAGLSVDSNYHKQACFACRRASKRR